MTLVYNGNINFLHSFHNVKIFVHLFLFIVRLVKERGLILCSKNRTDSSKCRRKIQWSMIEVKPEAVVISTHPWFTSVVSPYYRQTKRVGHRSKSIETLRRRLKNVRERTWVIEDSGE